MVADFHATRHTYVSGIVAGGASVNTCQELARHSSPVLTIGKYSHARLHDIAGALDELPDLQPEEPETERQALRATGRDGKTEQDAGGHHAGQLKRKPDASTPICRPL